MIYGNLVVSDRKGNIESYKLEVSFIKLKIIFIFSRYDVFVKELWTAFHEIFYSCTIILLSNSPISK